MSRASGELDFAALFKAAPDAMIVADGAGIIVCGNVKAGQLLGCPAAELQGRSLQQVLPGAPLQDAAAAEPFQLEALRQDGTPLQLEVSRGPFSADGASFTAVILRDVSLRAQAEKALRATEATLNTAQRLAQLGSWSWDVVTLEVEWSDGLFRMFGLKPGEFRATNDAYLQFIHPEDRDRARQAVAQALLGKTVYDMTYRVVWPDKSIHHMHDFGEVIRDAEGRALKMVGVVQDITERIKFRAALSESEAEHQATINRLGDALLYGANPVKK